MTSLLSNEQVLAIAALARLRLDAEEVDLFARQLGEILAYARQVSNVDTTGVPPTFSVAAAATPIRNESSVSSVTNVSNEVRRDGTEGNDGKQGEAAAVDRADQVRPSLARDLALANAPDPALDAGLYKVPKVIG